MGDSFITISEWDLVNCTVRPVEITRQWGPRRRWLSFTSTSAWWTDGRLPTGFVGLAAARWNMPRLLSDTAGRGTYWLTYCNDYEDQNFGYITNKHKMLHFLSKYFTSHIPTRLQKRASEGTQKFRPMAVAWRFHKLAEPYFKFSDLIFSG